MKSDIFFLLLEYIYTDEVNLNTTTALDLLKASDEYLIPRLKHICELFLIQHINELDIVPLINLSEKHEAHLLKKLAMK